MAKKNADELFQNENPNQGGALMFNLADTEEDSGFSAVPAGTYDCTVFNIEFKHSKSSGNPMWEVILETREQVGGRNARFWTYVIWTQAQAGRAKRFVNRVCPEALEGDKAREFNANDQNTINQFIGKACRARVTIEKYEGEDRNRVRDVLPADSGDSFLS